MTLGAEKDWREEFGLDPADANLFFAGPSEVARRGSPSSQAHVLRHAFKLLDLDGILCTEHAPLIYFKKVHRIDADAVADLHHRFWNHGGAPVLVLISRDEVHIYSGLVQPVERGDLAGRIPALVETLDRTSSALREFLPAVESGAFFRTHRSKFDPANRVDRALLDNLQQTRQILIEAAGAGRDTRVLDALLCRLVFACYLFDRDVIGPSYLQAIGFAEGRHLRDVLGLPRTRAKQLLYALFEKLGEDFNGDLFSTNLAAEARQIPVAQMETLSEFFHATRVEDGQRSFWPYNFAAIPVEVISAIYERFLQTSDRNDGAFYTPRFLAEAVLDVALAPMASLLDRRYLDPSCGSGIFLVGLFNRMAEEWKRSNPTVSSNDRRARELRNILCSSLYGIDVNPTACRITAFSLYLAYLDQLSPRDIQELQKKGHKLPRLVHYRGESAETVEGNIWCSDFFDESAPYPADVDLVIGNPPWGSTASAGTPAARWCGASDRDCPIPDKQISAAFIWKAARHVRPDGRVSLVLPHGTLFNHSSSALNFQRTFFEHHAVDHVLNLTDYRFFLFADAIHPAVVITYRPLPPDNPQHAIEYWAPKADWLVMRAQVISVAPEDRSRLTNGEVLADLNGPDAPQIWKQRHWTTARDRRLIERLSLYSRLRDMVRQSREKATVKRWLIAEGFQPVGDSDDSGAAVTIRLPSRFFVKARSPRLELFLLHHDCVQLESVEQPVRAKSNKVTEIFKKPHVLVTKGFSAAFADFDVSFRHAVRGISGPEEDRNLLAFLAAYLSSSLARYFAFHTSSNWGIYRPEVQVEELLRLPFPLPAELGDPSRARAIVNEVAEIVTRAAAKSEKLFASREEVVRQAQHSIEPLIDEYFDVMAQERVLVDDTITTIIPSVQPRLHQVVETMQPSGDPERGEYLTQLTETLNKWSRRGTYRVHGFALASSSLGIGIVVLEKAPRGTAAPAVPTGSTDLLEAFDRVRKAAAQDLNTFELIRGAKVFDGDRLYILKPIGRRFWTQTAALNDADEIAGTILMSTPQRPA
jgi:hypothetical protein